MLLEPGALLRVRLLLAVDEELGEEVVGRLLLLLLLGLVNWLLRRLDDHLVVPLALEAPRLLQLPVDGLQVLVVVLVLARLLLQKLDLAAQALHLALVVHRSRRLFVEVDGAEHVNRVEDNGHQDERKEDERAAPGLEFHADVDDWLLSFKSIIEKTKNAK